MPNTGPHTGNMKRFARRGSGLRGRAPECPTSCLPGTRAKLEVMVARVARGEDPHHPADARDTDLGRGVEIGDAVVSGRGSA